MSKAVSNVLRFVFVAVAGVLLTGCLLRRTTDSTRYFVLSPISTNEPSAAQTERFSVEIGFVKMPSYLLRNSIAVRNGDNEIQYLEDARWGERLDQNFQRTLAANLSRLLPSDRVYPSDSGHDQVAVRVSVNVQQFDLDTRGCGTLIAHWRILAADNDKPLKNGQARLVQSGALPRGHPEIIAKTLSDLTTEFSRELAKEIRESQSLSQ